DAFGVGGQHRRGVALDLHRVDRIALGDRVDHRQTFGDLAEHGVAAVQPVGLDVGDEELAAVGVGAGIGHGQHAALVRDAVAGFVLEAVAGAATAGALGAAALDHEVRDDAVERQAVVEPALGEVDEIGHGQGGLFGEQVHLDYALGGVEYGGQGHRFISIRPVRAVARLY